MNNLIKKIEITNFRSIQYCLIDCSEYNLFCGQNDVGKSNVLKALNLFFNQRTDFETPFNFGVDYNKYSLAEAQTSKKKKQFIKVKITFKTPQSYRSIQNTEFFIEKTFDRNDKTGLGTIKYSEESTKARSAISRILNQIRFVYIPALKGKEVIQYLLGLLGEQQLIGSTQIEDLNKSINTTTSDLSELLNDANIAIGATFGLPTLLSDFWRQLSVGTDYEYTEKIEQNLSAKKGTSVKLNASFYQIPLTMRGDGVKSKFLPPILKWLQNHNTHQTFIWGIDEPENSLEFRAAEALSNLFCDEYSKTTQIFATSHSMAFINPRDSAEIQPKVFRALRSQYGDTTFENINNLFERAGREDLLDEIGSLAIQKELITHFREKIDNEKKAKDELANTLTEVQNQLSSLTKPLLITEGKTDIKHILKAKEELDISDIDFECIDCDCQPDGDSNLRKLLEQLSKVHHSNVIIGIFDRDVDTIIKDIEKDNQPYKSFGNKVFAFCIITPQSRIDNGQTKISIEYLYNDNEVKTLMENGCRLFFGTEFNQHSMRHNSENLILNMPDGKGKDRVLENNGGQAVYDEHDTNVLAKKDDFAEAVLTNRITICNESWENFRPIFDKIRTIIHL